MAGSKVLAGVEVARWHMQVARGSRAVGRCEEGGRQYRCRRRQVAEGRAKVAGSVEGEVCSGSAGGGGRRGR